MAVGTGVSVGRGVEDSVASDCVISGVVVITHRLTIVTRATITIRVSPSAKSPSERRIVFVFLSSNLCNLSLSRSKFQTSEVSEGDIGSKIA